MYLTVRCACVRVCVRNETFALSLTHSLTHLLTGAARQDHTTPHLVRSAHIHSLTQFVRSPVGRWFRSRQPRRCPTTAAAVSRANKRTNERTASSLTDYLAVRARARRWTHTRTERTLVCVHSCVRACARGCVSASLLLPPPAPAPARRADSSARRCGFLLVTLRLVAWAASFSIVGDLEVVKPTCARAGLLA